MASASAGGPGTVSLDCGGFVDGGPEQLEVVIGQGDYAGTGAYQIDSTGNHGTLSYTVSASNKVMTLSRAASCTVHVTSAPAGNQPPAGATIAGTFDCQGLSDTPAPGAPTLDIQSGAFRVAIY